MSEPEDGVEEDPDYEVSSSNENETLSVDPPVVSQPPANTLPSKNGKVLWSVSPLEQQGRLHHHHHCLFREKWTEHRALLQQCPD